MVPILLALCELLAGALALAAACIVLELLNRAGGRLLLRAFGRTVFLAVTITSTTLHELSHAVMCLLFRHKIRKMRVFSLDPTTGRRSGFVDHSWDGRSLYQQTGNLFIGLAPMIVGVPLLLVIQNSCGVHTASGALSDTPAMLGPSLIRDLLPPIMAGLGGIFTPKNFANPYFYLCLPAAFVISRSMAPTLADLKASGTGASIVVFLFVAVNFIAFFLGHDPRAVVRAVMPWLAASLGAAGSAIGATLFFLVLAGIVGLVKKQDAPRER